MSRSTQDAQLKKTIKEALMELFLENRELFQDMIREALEDMDLLRAMQEGRKTKLVPREKVLQLLKGKK